MRNDKILAVDLDGTLIKSDILQESILIFLKRNPFKIFQLIIWLLKGRLFLKQKLSEIVYPSISNLPYNDAVINFIHKKKKDGFEIILATATINTIAHKISDYLNIFDRVIASSSENLSGKQKEAVLVSNFGKNKFEYIGNSMKDLIVWNSASQCHVVSPSKLMLTKLRNLNLGEIFNNNQSLFTMFFSAIRIHQWVKNILLFIPLAAAHRLFEIDLFINGLVAFLSFGLCASSIYLFNDLIDIEDDRNHEDKKNRQIAAGNLSIAVVLFLIAILLISSFAISYTILPMNFLLILLLYVFINIFYSIYLKNVILLDLFILAFLYTLRLVAGAEAMFLETTFWIITFSIFIFFSLAVVKRYTEFVKKGNINKGPIKVRSYSDNDKLFLLIIGIITGLISVLVLALYVNEVSRSGIYPQNELLWFSCPLLFYWMTRVWLLASRGEMNYDPVIFAIKDNQSRFIGFLFLSVFLLSAL